MATIEERALSRADTQSTLGQSGEATLLYKVRIDMTMEDETDVDSIVNSTAPSTYNSLKRKTTKKDPQGGGLFFVDVTYVTDDDSFCIDATVNNEKVYYALQTQHSYKGTSGAAADDDMKDGINVTEHGVDGVDIRVPKTTLTVTKIKLLSAVTDSYLNSQEELVGQVNDDSWSITVRAINRTYAVAEALLTRFRTNVKPTGEEVELTWDFEISRGVSDPDDDNGTAFLVGGIKVLEKNGWDYLWVKYKQMPAGGGSLRQEAIAVYIDQVYFYADFDILDI